MLARLSVLCAFLALLVVAAGCGGGGSSSGTASSQTGGSGGDKATFIEEADVVCTEYQEEVAPIKSELEALESVAEPESKANLTKLGGLVNKALVAAEAELDSIRELEIPQADEPTIEKMLATAEEGNGLAVEGATALEAGDPQKFGELVPEGEAINAKATKMAEGYGFKVCGQVE